MTERGRQKDEVVVRSNTETALLIFPDCKYSVLGVGVGPDNNRYHKSAIPFGLRLLAKHI